MVWNKSYCKEINLFVEGKILPADAERQAVTAMSVIEKLKGQPGLILADEVGMGKTFVALSVAVSVALSDENNRPVVIMIPSSLKEKWPKDLGVFVEKCLPPYLRKKVKSGIAESTVEFLKLLDDPLDKKNNLIFLTHGAFLRNMSDNWLRLAFIQRALFNRKDIGYVYSALYKYAGDLLSLKYAINQSDNIIEKLLTHKPDDWKKILVRAGVWEKCEDDPVPEQIIKILYELPGNIFNSLFSVLIDCFPKRYSEKFGERIKEARVRINEALRPIWHLCLKKIDHSLPLLILDEAHHLKNQKTHFARLFQAEETNDAKNTAGQLENVFERMLFLTATPFQLGHSELCNVLDRFSGINWLSAEQDGLLKSDYIMEIQVLRQVLDETQESALRFDSAWGTLKKEDLLIHDEIYSPNHDWWIKLKLADPETLSLNQRSLIDRYRAILDKMRHAEGYLKKYVIRHLRAKQLPAPFKGVDRRRILPGQGIHSGDENGGIEIGKESILPFLLAARLSSINPEKRPIFAEGLASSYEAFLNTRKKDWVSDPIDIDEPYITERPQTEAESDWYLGEIDSIVKDPVMSMDHPKIQATISKVLDLWKAGEKVLVFCHYIATGKALWLFLSRAMKDWVLYNASQKLKCDTSAAEIELEKLGDRFDEGYRLRTRYDEIIGALINSYRELDPHKENLMNVILRYFRTPSFLARFYPLGESADEEILLEKAFESKDASGLSLRQLLTNFLVFLAQKCGEDERKRYLESLLSVQTGEIRMQKTQINTDELDTDIQSENTLPNVRLVTGATEMKTRQNLMLTFNTPFYPDVLVATSVMAEGVDLHLNCRFIIHHDLSWNPSTLEQRTGRIDRIGAKVEQCGRSIEIYLPYVAATQDEKMYKVVMDRERWFNILMGEEYKEDFLSTEKIADRIPIPMEIVKELAFKLEIYNKDN